MFELSSTFESGAETENGRQPVQGTRPEPLGVLSSTAFGRSFSYQFTTDDVLWTARFLVGEAGGRDDCGAYPGTTVPRGQLRRHLQLQSMPWTQLPAAARSLAERC